MVAKRSLYTPQHPEKYVGEYPIVSRSSWEEEFMKYCDMHPDVLEWASEPIQIPYHDPITGKQKIYIPDFLATMIDKQGELHKKLIEIKPLHEAYSEHARNTKDAAILARNQAKWTAAQGWAMRRGITFIIMTEADLFTGHNNRKPRMNPVHAYVPDRLKKQQAIKKRKAKATTKKPRKLGSTRKKVVNTITKARKARTGKVSKARKR